MSTASRSVIVRAPGTRLVPAISLRIVVGCLGLGALLVVPLPYALIVIGFSVLAAISPRSMGGWLAIAVALVGLIALQPLASWAQLVIALVLVHALHVASSLALVVPARGLIDARIIVRAALRWVSIQVPAQLLLFGVVVAMGATSGAAPEPTYTVVAGAGVFLLALLVALGAYRKRDDAVPDEADEG